MANNDTIDYQILFDRSPIASLIFRRKGQQIVLAGYNHAAAETLGNISPEFVNASIKRIFIDCPELLAWLEGCFVEKNLILETAYYREDNDKAHPSLKFVATYLDENLRLVHLENIHKQRQAEEDFRKSKERLELAIHATDAGLWDWHIPSGEVIFGEQWAAILGYTLDEIEPHVSTWEKLLHPDDQAQAMQNLERHLSGEMPRYESEHRLKGKNGNWVWVLDVGKVVEWDDQKNPLRMAGTKVDISERKRMEAELEGLNSDLEKRIEKRTRRLRQSEKSLIESQGHLKRQSKHLQEVNSALKVLLKKSAENKKEIGGKHPG